MTSQIDREAFHCINDVSDVTYTTLVFYSNNR